MAESRSLDDYTRIPRLDSSVAPADDERACIATYPGRRPVGPASRASELIRAFVFFMAAWFSFSL